MRVTPVPRISMFWPCLRREDACSSIVISGFSDTGREERRRKDANAGPEMLLPIMRIFGGGMVGGLG